MRALRCCAIMPVMAASIRLARPEDGWTLRDVERLAGERFREVGLPEVADDERKAFRGLQPLTSKPLLYVCNVEEDAAATGNALSEAVAAR